VIEGVRVRYRHRYRSPALRIEANAFLRPPRAAAEAFGYEDGYVPLPDGPGLGIEIDEEAVAERAGPHGWHNPVWRHADGSVAEW